MQNFEDVGVLISFSRLCLAALALSRIIFNGRDSEVEPGVEGRASGDKWVKAGSLGKIGRPSCECLQTWFTQAEALSHCILGFSLPLQYRQARATFRWSRRI